MVVLLIAGAVTMVVHDRFYTFLAGQIQKFRLLYLRHFLKAIAYIGQFTLLRNSDL